MNPFPELFYEDSLKADALDAFDAKHWGRFGGGQWLACKDRYVRLAGVRGRKRPSQPHHRSWKALAKVSRPYHLSAKVAPLAWVCPKQSAPLPWHRLLGCAAPPAGPSAESRGLRGPVQGG